LRAERLAQKRAVDGNVDANCSAREALAHLVAGALGSYKNPHRHRKVALTGDESVEMVILASHIINIVDSRARR
jgi:hypothetical protein